MKRAGSAIWLRWQYRDGRSLHGALGSARTSLRPHSLLQAAPCSSARAGAFSPDARNENDTRKTNWPASLQCPPLLHRPSLPIEKNPELATRSAPRRFSQICRPVTAIRECYSLSREHDGTDKFYPMALPCLRNHPGSKRAKHIDKGFVQDETASTCRCRGGQQEWQESVVLCIRRHSCRLSATVMDKQAQ